MTKIEAVYKGNFKNIFGIDATYYILNDPKHSVVMTQRELGRVLKFAESCISSAIKDFAKTKTMANYRGGEILAKGNRAKYENDFAEIFGGQLQFDFDALDREDALNEVKNNKITQEILKDYPDLFNQDNKDFDIVLNEIVKK